MPLDARRREDALGGDTLMGRFAGSKTCSGLDICIGLLTVTAACVS